MQSRVPAALVVALLGTVLGSVLNTGAAVAVPDVLRTFPATPVATSSWVLTAYVLGTAAFMPLAGRVADRAGPAVLLASSMAGMAAASVVCATAPSFGVLAAGRLLQGVFGAAVLPVVFQVVQRAVPEAERGRALSWWAATNGASLAAGPLVGGALVDLGGWRTLHIAVIPVLAAGAVAASKVLPGRTAGEVKPRTPGAATFTAAAVLVMIAVAQTAVWGPVAPPTVAVALGAAGCAVAFVRRTRRASVPFIDLRLLAEPRWRLACAAVALQMVAMYGVLLVLPLLVVEVRDRSTSFASAIYALMPVASVALARTAGRAVDRVGAGPPLRTGGALLAAGGLALLPAASGSPWWLVPGLVLIGAGIGLIQTPAAVVAAAAAGTEGSGPALGLFNAVRFFAGSVGAAAFTLLFRAVAGTTDADSLRRRPIALVERGFGAVFVGVAVAGVALVAVVALAERERARTPAPAVVGLSPPGS